MAFNQEVSVAKNDVNKKVDFKIPHEALVLGYRSKGQIRDIEERIKNAMRIVACLIADGSEEYLPIFQRLETELEDLQVEKAVLSRALKLAQSSTKRDVGF